MGEWRVVDADHFKEVLLREALADGSYQSWLLPPDVAELQAGGERFYPLELAALVHEESSRLAIMARRQAIEAGEQLVVDSVLKDPDNAIALGRLLEDAGYEVTVVEVEVSLQQSLARTRVRWENGYRRAERGEAGAELGGRWVPSEYPESLYQDGTASSRCLVSARVLADSCAAVMRFEQYAPNSSNGELVRVDARVRDERGGYLLHELGDPRRSAAEAARIALADSAGPRTGRPAVPPTRPTPPRQPPQDRGRGPS